MSLRKGHLRSGMWAPPTLRDDWRDEAACTGKMDLHVDPITCASCPVTADCAALYGELSEIMGESKAYGMRMPGTWAGVNYPEKKDHPAMGNKGGGRWKKGEQPINGGVCTDDECVRAAYRRGMCSMHYQRMMNARGQ